VYYRERSTEDIRAMSPKELGQLQKDRESAHAAWHEEFSGEYDDCPFQFLGEDWLTEGERKVLTGRDYPPCQIIVDRGEVWADYGPCHYCGSGRYRSTLLQTGWASCNHCGAA